MLGAAFEEALKVLEEESRPLLAVRKLNKIEIRHWWGVGLIFENPGRVLLRLFVDYRDRYVDVNFMSPDHLNEDHTFVKFPYFDDPRHRFALWQVLKAQGLPSGEVSGAIDVGDLIVLRSFVKRAIECILERYLDILDGDLSISTQIGIYRARGPWDSDGE